MPVPLVESANSLHLEENYFMTILTKTAAGIFIAVSFLSFRHFTKIIKNPGADLPQQLISQATKPIPEQLPEPISEHLKIQAAILLDVSNSMDGLIDQAKAQLWNMVSVMGKAKCNEATPQIEIALYEYGRTTNNEKRGFVKQISPFTNDLDQLSQYLFNLKTNGGDEFCGHAIYSSVNELKWDTTSGNYKVIFIAGNEDFLQGDITFTRACKAAKQKGVIVNTIYCGDKTAGIEEHWNLAGECGNGSYTNINKNAQLDNIETPYDSILFSLNEKLNGTYISYGYHGNEGLMSQAKTDKMNTVFNKSAALKRVGVKGKKELYKNSTWDLVDAEEADKTILDKVDLKTLPDSMQNKSREELKKIVKIKTEERNTIQQLIAKNNAKRETYIVHEKSKKAGADNNATLETEIEKIIRQQAKRFHMEIK